MRSKFLTFFFAWFVGAGQMYQGYMKRGVMLMLSFFGCFTIAITLRIELILMFMPVIYAAAFFDTFNLARLTPQEREKKPDVFFFGLDKMSNKISFDALYEKRHKWVGWGLMGLGTVLIYFNFISPILWQIHSVYNYQWLARAIYAIPTLVVAGVVMLLGLRLLKGAPKAITSDEIIEFVKEDKND